MKLHEMVVELIDDDEEHESWNYEEHNRLLERHSVHGDKFITISEIVVPTERDKQQILQAFKYLHDNRIIDSDFIAVNSLVHTYMNPDLIKVKS